MGFLNKLFQANSNFQADPNAGLNPNNQININPALTSTLANLTGSGPGSQQAFGQYLQGQLAGTGPSLANQQLKTALNQNVNQGAAQIGSIRGINPALAARQIMQNTAAATQNAEQQGAQNRIQEELNAQGQTGALLGQEAGTVGTLGGIQNTQNAQGLQGALTAEQLNQQTQAQNAGQNASTAGGVLGGIGAAIGLAKGGEVPAYAGGGPVVEGSGVGAGPSLESVPVGDFKSGFNAITKAKATPTTPEEADTEVPDLSGYGAVAGGQGEAPVASPLAMPEDQGAQLAARGGRITGKAKVPGDSPSNDTVPAMLSPGEEVLPRSVTMSKHPGEKAKAFVEHIKKMHKKKGSEESPSYGHVIASQRNLHERLSRLEKMASGGVVTGISKDTANTFSQGFNSATGFKKVAGGKK